MIVSFHPIISGDKNIVCAGRDPDTHDLNAIKNANAVILPQGCKKPLYEMARINCRQVFPNYDMRFAFPGKLGQIRLFRKVGIHHPHTLCFEDLNSFCLQFSGPEKTLPFSFPFVFKFDWGGEGDMVFLIRSQNEFSDAIKKARHFENTGQKGFLIQEYVPSGSKSLRIAVIGRHLCSYWRIQKNPTIFKTGLSCGSSIDYQSDPETIQTAESVLKNFLKTTKINLAGFDFLISKFSKKIYILEINYFFGRRGLGGSEAFYAILISEINQWLKSLGYTRNLSIDTN